MVINAIISLTGVGLLNVAFYLYAVWLLIAFMRDTCGVTRLVLGADNAEQVIGNIAYFDTPTLCPEVSARLQKEFANVNIPEIMKVLSRPKN